MNVEKEQRAISYLKNFEPKTEPYYLCYSGGKDSDTIRILADLAGVSYECHNNHTGVDAPETVMYIRDVMSQYGEMKIERDAHGRKTYRYGDRGFVHLPVNTMWDLIVKNRIPPTRIARYCCSELKEKGGSGRRKITGVRWDESTNRKNNHDIVTIIGKPKTTIRIAEELGANYLRTGKGGVILNTDNDPARRVVESCYRTTSTMVNPIVDWTDSDVWDFLRHYGCGSNPLYQQGYHRIGCIGCPMASPKERKRDFARYPQFERAYRRAFAKMLERRTQDGLEDWKHEKEVFDWWMEDRTIPGQMELELEE